MTMSEKSINEYTLPERLRYMRERRKFSQAELAKKAGVSQSTIAQIEGGKKDHSISTLLRIADALDTHVAVLFASDEVHVFDMKRLKSRYDHVDKLNSTLYAALGRVFAWAKSIGWGG